MYDLLPAGQELFDYNLLDTETREFLLEQETLMELVLRRTAYELGTILMAVKERLPYGMYGKWLKSKGISKQTAHEWVKIAKGLPPKSPKIGLLSQPEQEVSTDWRLYFPFWFVHAHGKVYIAKPLRGQVYILDDAYLQLVGSLIDQRDNPQYANRLFNSDSPICHAIYRELIRLQGQAIQRGNLLHTVVPDAKHLSVSVLTSMSYCPSKQYF